MNSRSIPRLGSVLLASLLIGACSSPSSPYDQRRYVCSALCYFRNKDGALEREMMDGRGSSLKAAWRELQRVCDRRTEDRNQAELEVVLREEMHEYRPADLSRECRED